MVLSKVLDEEIDAIFKVGILRWNKKLHIPDIK